MESFFWISVRLRWGITLRIITMMPPPEVVWPARCILNPETDKCVIGNEELIFFAAEKYSRIFVSQNIIDFWDSSHPTDVRVIHKVLACLIEFKLTSLWNPQNPFNYTALCSHHDYLPHNWGHSDRNKYAINAKKWGTHNKTTIGEIGMTILKRADNHWLHLWDQDLLLPCNDCFHQFSLFHMWIYKKRVSQMWALLEACLEPAGDQNRSPSCRMFLT